MGKIINHVLRIEVEWVLIHNVDLFEWFLTNMLDIDPDFMCHKLTILPQAKLVAQRKRKPGEEQHIAINQAVSKLLKVDFIREIVYTGSQMSSW